MNYDQLATDAQNKGNAATATYSNKANDFNSQYGNYQNQADAANQNIQAQNDYMKGAGSANNLYTGAFNDQAAKTGFNSDALRAAQTGLTNAVGTQSAFNDFANQAASKWGLNAGGLAAANAGATQGLNNNIASQGGALAAQQKAFDQAQLGANQQTGANLQQQTTQLQGYENAFNAAFQQQKSAQDNMQFYQNLAQQQGGLTAQQVQAYQNAKAQSAAATASLAAASLASAQARQTNQQTDAQARADAIAKANHTGVYATPNANVSSQSFTPQSAQSIVSDGVSSPAMKQAAQQFLTNYNNSQARSQPQQMSAFGQSVANVISPVANWWNSLPTV